MPPLAELTPQQHPFPIDQPDPAALPLHRPTERSTAAPRLGSPGFSTDTNLADSSDFDPLADQSGLEPLADPRMSLLEQLERRQDQVLLELDQLDRRVLQLIDELGRYRSNL